MKDIQELLKEILNLLKIVYLMPSSKMSYAITILVIVCVIKCVSTILECINKILVMIYILCK